MKPSSPFKDFKFKVGDTVRHKTNSNGVYLVVQRSLIETPEGIGKRYECSSIRVDGEVLFLTAHEMSLMLVPGTTRT